MTAVTRIFEPLKHPGPAQPTRITTVPATSHVSWVTLAPGLRLVDALDRALAQAGLRSAQVELLDGMFAQVSYCFPALAGGHPGQLTYSQTYEAITPARLITGSATVGFRGGERFVHCHAAWFDAEGGLHGGHLWPDTWIYPAPMHAIVHALDGVTSTSDIDEETQLPVFTPAACEPRAVPTAGVARRAVMARVGPGQEFVGACGKIMRSAGFAQALVSASLGSFVGAALRRPGSVLVVEGPGAEVSLGGQMSLDADGGISADISAVAIDRHGHVHVGQLAGRENIVAVTVELLVEEAAVT